MWLVDTNINKGVPSSPEIAVGNDTNGVAQLILDIGRNIDHQADELLLDGDHLLLWKLVISILIL